MFYSFCWNTSLVYICFNLYFSKTYTKYNYGPDILKMSKILVLVLGLSGKYDMNMIFGVRTLHFLFTVHVSGFFSLSSSKRGAIVQFKMIMSLSHRTCLNVATRWQQGHRRTVHIQCAQLVHLCMVLFYSWMWIWPGATQIDRFS